MRRLTSKILMTVMLATSPDERQRSKLFSMYTLIDPETGHIRYIGQTCRKVTTRFSQHKAAAKKGTKQKLYAWIKGLLLKGKEPVCEEVFRGCTKNEINDLEYKWIGLFRGSEYLLNRSDGGATNTGWGHSEEQKLKWRAERRGENHPNYGKKHPHLSEPSRQRILKTLREKGHPMQGRKRTQEAIDKTRASKVGKTPKQTEELKKQRSDLMKERWKNPEFVEKIRAAASDAAAAGKASGLNSGRSSLTLKDVWNIYYARCAGIPQVAAGKMYNTSGGMTFNIWRKRSYKKELENIFPLRLVD